MKYLFTVVHRCARSRTKRVHAIAALRRDASAEERHQRLAQRVRPAGCEDHLGAGFVAFAAGRPEQVGRRAARWRAPDRSSRPAMAQAVSAGPAAADNACRRARRCRCAALAISDEAGGEFGGDVRVADRVAAERGFSQRGELCRSDQRHLAALREIADQALGVFALARCPWCRAPRRVWSSTARRPA